MRKCGIGEHEFGSAWLNGKRIHEAVKEVHERVIDNEMTEAVE